MESRVVGEPSSEAFPGIGSAALPEGGFEGSMRGVTVLLTSGAYCTYRQQAGGLYQLLRVAPYVRS